MYKGQIKKEKDRYTYFLYDLEAWSYLAGQSELAQQPPIKGHDVVNFGW